MAVMGSWRPLSGEIVNSFGQGKGTIAIWESLGISKTMWLCNHD